MKKNKYMQYLAEQIPEKASRKLVKSAAEKYYKSHSLEFMRRLGQWTGEIEILIDY